VIKLLTKRGITLLELLIAISILVMIGVGVMGLHIASRRTLASAARLVGVHDEARHAMEHMVRNIRLANTIVLPEATEVNITIDDDRDPADPNNDTAIAYRLSDNEILYSNIDTDGDPPDIVDDPIAGNIYSLAFNIAADPVDPIFLTIDITAAHDASTYDPTSVDPDNPGVTLHAGVILRCRARD